MVKEPGERECRSAGELLLLMNDDDDDSDGHDEGGRVEGRVEDDKE